MAPGPGSVITNGGGVTSGGTLVGVVVEVVVVGVVVAGLAVVVTADVVVGSEVVVVGVKEVAVSGNVGVEDVATVESTSDVSPSLHAAATRTNTQRTPATRRIAPPPQPLSHSATAATRAQGLFVDLVFPEAQNT